MYSRIPIYEKATLAANTNDMEVGKIYPAPVKKSKKATVKKQIKKKIRKNIKKNTAPRTVPHKSTPMISFNYDLRHQDHQINSLRTNTPEPKPVAVKPKPADKPSALANNSSKSGHPYIGVMFETSIAKVGEDQWDTTRDAVNGCYQYEPSSGYKARFAYGINGGYEFSLKKQLPSVSRNRYLSNFESIFRWKSLLCR